MNVGTLTISLTARTASLAKAAGGVKAFESGVVASVQRINASISTIGMAFSALTIPIASIGIGSIKMFSEFEFSLAKVEGLIGIAKDQTNAWGAEVLELAKSIGKSANEMGEALYFTASAGIRGANTMKIVKISAQASAAGMGESKKIADLLTSAMNAYGENALSASDAMDILATAVREGKVEAEDLIMSIDKVLPISSAMGVSFNEVGAAIAGLTRTGTSAQTSGMMVRRVLLGIQKPTQDATKTLEGLGMSFADLRDIVANEKGGLLKALLKLKGVVDTYGEEKLARIFPNLRAYIPVLDLLGKNLEKNKSIWMEMLEPTGNFQLLLDATANTFQKQFAVAVNAAGQALIQLGHTFAKTLMPIIQEFAKKVNDFSNWWTGLSRQTQNLIVKITLLTGVIGPLSLLFSSLVGIVMSIVGAIGSLVTTLLSATTILFLFAAGVVLIATNMKDWKQVLLDIDNMLLKNKFQAMMENNQKLIESTSKRWREFVGAIKGELEEKGELAALKGVEERLIEINKKQFFLNRLQQDFSSITDIEKKEVHFQKMKDVLDEIYDIQKEIVDLSNVRGSSKRGAMGVIDTSREMQLSLWSKQIDAGFATAPVENVGDHMKDAFLGSIDNIIKAAEEKFPEFTKTINEYKEKFQNMFDGDGAGSFPAVAEVDVAAQLREKLEKIAQAGLEFHPVMDIKFNVLGNSGESISAFDGLYQQFQLDQTRIRESAMQIGESFDYVGEKLSLYNSFVGNVEKLGLPYSPEQLEIMKAVYGELVKLKAETKPVEDAFKRMFGTIARLASSVSSLFVDLGTVMGESFQEAVKPLVDFIRILESVFRVIDNVTKIAAMLAKEKEKDTAMDIANTATKAMNTAATETNTIAKQANAAASGINATATAAESSADLVDAGTKMTDAAATGTNTAAKATNTASKIANAIASAIEWLVTTLGPVGIMLAIGAVAGIISLFSSGKNKASGAAKMAHGGVVPPGFPNDSYPAFLTSGEAVVPPGKLPKFESDFDKGGLKEIKLSGDWKIRGRDLYYVIKEEQRLIGNAFG